MTAAFKSFKALPVKIIFGIAVLLLFVMSFFLLDKINSQADSASRTRRTNQVRLYLGETVMQLKEAESSQRGFLLLQDSSFFRSMLQAYQSIHSNLNALESLYAAKPAQKKQVDTLRLLVNQRIEILENTLLLQKRSDTTLQASMSRGDRVMDAIRQQVQKMVDNENQLLKMQETADDQIAFVTPLYAWLLIVFALFIFLLSFFSLNRQLRLSQSISRESERVNKKLKQSNAQLEHAERIADLGSWELNWDSRLFKCSKNLFRLYGIEPMEEEVPFDDFLNFVYMADRHKLQDAINNVIREKTYSVDFRIIRADGQLRYMQSNGKLKSNSLGRTLILGTTQDMTADKTAAEDLKNTNTLFENAEETAGIGSWKWNIDTKEFIVSKNLFQLYGFRPFEFRPSLSSFFQYVHPEDKEKLNQISARSLMQKQFMTVNYRIITKDGNLKYVQGIRKYLKNEKGEQVVLGTTQDVSELMQTMNKLRSSQAFNRRITNLAPNAIYIFDINTGQVAYANKFLKEMLGYTREEMEQLGNNQLSVLLHPDDLPVVIQNFKRFKTVGDENIVELEYRLRNKTGEYRHQLAMEAVFKRNECGEVTQIIGVATDITELKKAAAKLQQLNVELTEKNLDLQQVNEELASFNYVASHDLQEPLRKIQTFINYIEERECDGVSDTALEYIKRIKLAAGRMRTLIQDLLSYSRTGEIPEEMELVDLNEVLQHAQSTLKATIDEKDAIIHANKLPVVRGIPFQMEQLFENLIGNALKYCRPDIVPSITITAEVQKGNGTSQLLPEQRYYKISFRDNGIGFEQEYAGKIFELFQRLHAKNEFEGTGIGLAICKKIVLNHAGTIMARGVPDQGATFEIYLPVDAS